MAERASQLLTIVELWQTLSKSCDLKTGPLTFMKQRLLVDADSIDLIILILSIVFIHNNNYCMHIYRWQQFNYWCGHMPHLLSSDVANLVILWMVLNSLFQSGKRVENSKKIISPLNNLLGYGEPTLGHPKLQVWVKFVFCLFLHNMN